MHIRKRQCAFMIVLYWVWTVCTPGPFKNALCIYDRVILGLECVYTRPTRLADASWTQRSPPLLLPVCFKKEKKQEFRGGLCTCTFEMHFYSRPSLSHAVRLVRSIVSTSGIVIHFLNLLLAVSEISFYWLFACSVNSLNWVSNLFLKLMLC